MTIAELERQLKRRDAVKPAINPYVAFFILIFGLSVLIRITATPHNTIFYDEAVSATVGLEVIRSDFSEDASSWTFGSYLYPVLASIVSFVGGHTGLQILSVILNIAAMLAITATTYRLFGINSAMFAMAIFGLMGGSINLSLLAVYDSLGIPLLALAFFLGAASAYADGHQQGALLAGAGVIAGVSVLVKYTGAFYLPALAVILVATYLARNRNITPLIIVALPMLLVVVLPYVVLNFEDLYAVFVTNAPSLSVPATPTQIIVIILEEIGLIMAIALCGGLMLVARLLLRHHPSYSGLVNVIILVIAMLLPALVLLVPLYHIFMGNQQSLWQHCLYSAIFLVPVAGYALGWVVDVYSTKVTSGSIGLRLFGAVATGIIVLMFIDVSMQRHWGFMQSWPNAGGAVAWLQQDTTITYKTRILAEQAAVYEYYLDLGAFDRDVWSNTFYLEARNVPADHDITQAIASHYFDYIILDDYYTAQKNIMLERAAEQAGYTLVYRDPQPQILSTGQEITVRIWKAPES